MIVKQLCAILCCKVGSGPGSYVDINGVREPVPVPVARGMRWKVEREIAAGEFR
jgi:hypothetical protein